MASRLLWHSNASSPGGFDRKILGANIDSMIIDYGAAPTESFKGKISPGYENGAT
jgi:hypothetical protein